MRITEIINESTNEYVLPDRPADIAWGESEQRWYSRNAPPGWKRVTEYAFRKNRAKDPSSPAAKDRAEFLRRRNYFNKLNNQLLQYYSDDDIKSYEETGLLPWHSEPRYKNNIDQSYGTIYEKIHLLQNLLAMKKSTSGMADGRPE